MAIVLACVGLSAQVDNDYTLERFLFFLDSAIPLHDIFQSMETNV